MILGLPTEWVIGGMILVAAATLFYNRKKFLGHHITLNPGEPQEEEHVSLEKLIETPQNSLFDPAPKLPVMKGRGLRLKGGLPPKGDKYDFLEKKEAPKGEGVISKLKKRVKETHQKIVSRQEQDELNKYCMHEYDAGTEPMSIEKDLEETGITHKQAKDIAFKNYRTWVENRLPLLKKKQELVNRAKIAEKKYLQRKIDEKTVKEMLKDLEKESIAIEAKIRETEKMF